MGYTTLTSVGVDMVGSFDMTGVQYSKKAACEVGTYVRKVRVLDGYWKTTGRVGHSSRAQ